MINSGLLAVIYGLTSAASWGAGDFCGGLASKHNSAYTVVAISQLIGAIFLAAVALLLGEPIPTLLDFGYGAIAGISGAIGLVALYRGLALGRMGVVAPVAAVVSVLVPMVAGAVLEGLPATQQLFGFLVALLGVWLLSRTGDKTKFQIQDLGLATVAGLGFGFFFIIIDRVNDGAVLWPLVGARVASVTLLTILIMVVVARQENRPTLGQMGQMTLSGIFDTGGNAFFVLATQTGRLDISAILSSLYPVSTIALAWFILQERLLPQQWLGVVAALGAVILIAS